MISEHYHLMLTSVIVLTIIAEMSILIYYTMIKKDSKKAIGFCTIILTLMVIVVYQLDTNHTAQRAKQTVAQKDAYCEEQTPHTHCDMYTITHITDVLTDNRMTLTVRSATNHDEHTTQLQLPTRPKDVHVGDNVIITQQQNEWIVQKIHEPR